MRRGAVAVGVIALLVVAAALGWAVASSASTGRAHATKLTVWVGWSARELSEFKKVVAEYDAKNPNVTVDVVGSINDDKIIAALRSGNAPDVAAPSRPRTSGSTARRVGGSTSVHLEGREQTVSLTAVAPQHTGTGARFWFGARRAHTSTLIPIFVRDKNVYTSAGVAAGMDFALALVEEDHGSRLALHVARNMVLYLRRPGGQSQFSAALSLQLTDREPLRELESWVLDNLNKPLAVPALAKRVAMSPPDSPRIFTKEMKTTPAKFVERLRVETARRRLEESQNSMELSRASECGFGNVNSMRNVFQRTLKIAPGQYRRHFRHVKRRTRAKTKS